MLCEQTADLWVGWLWFGVFLNSVDLVSRQQESVTFRSLFGNCHRTCQLMRAVCLCTFAKLEANVMLPSTLICRNCSSLSFAYSNAPECSTQNQRHETRARPLTWRGAARCLPQAGRLRAGRAPCAAPASWEAMPALSNAVWLPLFLG